jgi:hypothetical protein
MRNDLLKPLATVLAALALLCAGACSTLSWKGAGEEWRESLCRKEYRPSCDEPPEF